MSDVSTVQHRHTATEQGGALYWNIESSFDGVHTLEGPEQSVVGECVAVGNTPTEVRDMLISSARVSGRRYRIDGPLGITAEAGS